MVSSVLNCVDAVGLGGELDEDEASKLNGDGGK